jgi:superfamily I DNA/RNA helicase
MLARANPEGQILLTTFSKTLASRLSQGMDTLLGPSSAPRKRVEVKHLHAYAYAHVSRIEAPTIADQRTIDEFIDEACRKFGGDFDKTFLHDEWDAVIDFWGITSYNEYREIPRTGRGAALSPRARQRLWDVFSEVRRSLAIRKLNTFGEICDRVRLRIEADGAHPFEHVVVDEAQDLGPRELRLVASLATLRGRGLFFAGDVGQRIYRWPFSWLAAGIDVRGRAQRLKVNYRTSAEIRRFSDRLLPARLTEVDGEAEERGTLSLLRGPEPEIKGSSNIDDEIDVLANWLDTIRKHGIGPEEIAIFARTRKALDERARPALARNGLSGAWLSPDQDIVNECVNFGTLHAAKGLEFRAVAIVSCDDDHLPLQGALDTASEPESKRLVEERELSLLYVGCTRARDQLLISWSGTPSRFLSIPSG